MTRHQSAVPWAYSVDPTEPYVCMQCGRRIPLRGSSFHRAGRRPAGYRDRRMPRPSHPARSVDHL